MSPRTILIMTVVILSGCTTLTPEYQRPLMDLPGNWPEPVRLSMDERRHWRDWWLRYGDPELNRLIAQALEYNLDLLQATTRIRESRAILGQRRAEQFPTVDAQADASRQDVGPVGFSGGIEDDIDSGTAVDGGTSRFSGIASQYRFAAALNYEIDLWGRLSQATESARTSLLQSIFSRDAVQLTVIGDVASTYFELRAVQNQIQITRDSIASREEAYELEQARFKYGASTELALRQAEADLQNTRARLPRLMNQENNLGRALSVLTGDTPRAIVAAENLPARNLEAIHFDSTIPEIVPSALLERRPDVRAAEAGLIAANYDIGVARANWFPRINLAASLGTLAIDIGSAFFGPSMIWSLGGSVVEPLLDFGAREAEIEGAEARRDLAEMEYRGTVRAAFVEVGDAWSLLKAANEELELRGREVEALRKTVRLAESRYKGGYSSYIEVLDARRTLFEAELSHTEAARDRLAATVTLYKALGGGWSEDELKKEFTAGS